jgi:hypothetical protein
LEAALSAAFVRLDSEIKKTVPDGTTASVVLLKRSPDGARTALPACPRYARRLCERHVTLVSPVRPSSRAPRATGGVGVKCAWVGDSRAVLVRYSDIGGKPDVTALTRDHKARRFDTQRRSPPRFRGAVGGLHAAGCRRACAQPPVGQRAAQAAVDALRPGRWASKSGACVAAASALSFCCAFPLTRCAACPPFRSAATAQASDVMEAARIEAFYAALKRRPSSARSDSDEGSVRTHTTEQDACAGLAAFSARQLSPLPPRRRSDTITICLAFLLRCAVPRRRGCRL